MSRLKHCSSAVRSTALLRCSVIKTHRTARFKLTTYSFMQSNATLSKLRSTTVHVCIRLSCHLSISSDPAILLPLWVSNAAVIAIAILWSSTLSTRLVQPCIS